MLFNKFTKVLFIFSFVVILGNTFIGQSQGETFRVLSVHTAGCNAYQFTFSVERANLDGGTYILHTVVTAGGLIYMNEDVTISVNGVSGWALYPNFNYGSVPNPGAFPIPADTEMRVDFYIERPMGTRLFEWVFITDGCNTGAIVYNGPSSIPPTATPEITATPEAAVTHVATYIPLVELPPPPVPLCEDHNFDTNGVVRSSLADTNGFAVNCRIIYQNGIPIRMPDGTSYSSANLGVEGLIELGVIQAIDIFSPANQTYFEGGAVFCLRGSGHLIWLAASQAPRHPEIIGSYAVEEWEGFTCATIFEPGTLILLNSVSIDINS